MQKNLNIKELSSIDGGKKMNDIYQKIFPLIAIMIGLYGLINNNLTPLWIIIDLLGIFYFICTFIKANIFK